MLSAALFALAGLINGLFARSFDHTSVIATFVLTPLIYLGGLFYPVARLDEPWQSLAAANPMHYMIAGFRHGLLGTGAFAGTTTFAILVVATGVVGGGAWWLVARGFRIRA